MTATPRAILITGANGHLGSNVVRELLSRNELGLRAMTRATSDTRGLDGVEVGKVHGDIMDASSVRDLADGCDAIVNLAAVYSLSARRVDDIVRPAIAGIEHVLTAAAAHGVRRVVHVSSFVAVGPSTRPDRPRTEDDWNDDAELPYHVAKTRSERIAHQRAKELGVELVCINPGAILGPWDFKPTPSMGFIRDLAKGRARTVRGGINHVDVRDVAWLVAEAIDRGTPGRYLCGGENVDLKELGRLVGREVGTPVSHLPLPRPLLLTSVRITEWIARALGRRPPVAYAQVSQLVGRWLYGDCQKAKDTFGFSPRSAAEQVRDAVAWLRRIGELPPAG